MTTANVPVTGVVPRRSKLNVRLVVFLTVVAVPFLLIAGIFIRDAMSHGIVDHGDYKDVDLRALGNFPFSGEEGTIEQVPQQYRSLDGQKVRLTGYMVTSDAAGPRGRRFQFVYNVQRCCFNGPPQVQERVFAYAKKDQSLFDQYQFAEVVGTLHVRVVRDKEAKTVVSVYDMDVESTRALN